jgi:hypothetical protein
MKIKRINFETYLKIIIMPLLTTLPVLIVAVVLPWLVNKIIPMNDKNQKDI